LTRFTSKNLLIISPHFKLFLREQVTAIAQFFSKVTVMVPRPYFPNCFLNVAFFNDKLPFLKNALESHKQANSDQIDIICPKFMTLPIETMRNRIPIFGARSVIHALKKTNVKSDLVHAHRLDNGFAGAILKDLSGIPLVITSHGSDVYDFPFRNNFTYAIAQYTLSRADHAIAVCKSDADKLLSLGTSPEKVSIIPNGFDSNVFKPIPQSSARRELGLPMHKKILLSVGTLHEVKGHTYLIDAIKVLLERRRDFLTVIIGSGPLENMLKRKIEQLGLAQNIMMPGWIPHNRLSLWMNACDVFVLPSLNEGLPTVIPEVLACGKPVVATRVGGIPDLIISDKVGLLANPRDSESLASAISEALSRKWYMVDIQRYSRRYSLENISNRILQVYQYVS
jgi:glycosyltransferase involved in cell wall biosynthesis